MDDYRRLFGNRLQYVRQYHGDSQKELAFKLKSTVYSIRAWEQGRSYPGVDKIIDICRIYGVSSDYLFGLSDDDPILGDMEKEKLNPFYSGMIRRFHAFLVE